MEKLGLGLNPSSQIHYTDHLAVICILMGIPLLFIDELDYSLGQKYYPGLNAIKQEYEGFNPEYLIANYDVLFMSDLWDRDTFHEKFGGLEKKYHKVLRHVHVPHGYSDKSFYLKKAANEDIVLVYGQNMLDMFKEAEVFENLHHYVITGNYRLTFFKQNRAFYDQIIEKEVLGHFAKKQPVILYAPTWLDLEESTTFFDTYHELLEKLPSDYNMIVKLHPRLELDDTAKYYHIVGKYESKPNILFLKDFPLVYPLLAHSDMYLGDMSSVGYDFLPFNKPMFFLNKHKKDAKYDRNAYLFRCGIPILPDRYSQIYQIIEQNLTNDVERFGSIRREVDHYTFGIERSFDDIKADIVQAYSDDYYASIACHKNAKSV